MTSAATTARIIVAGAIVACGTALALGASRFVGVRSLALVGGVTILAGTIWKYFERSRSGGMRWSPQRFALMGAAGGTSVCAYFEPSHGLMLGALAVSLMAWSARS